MKEYLLMIPLIIGPFLSNGQTQHAKDSLIAVMCKEINDNWSLSDSARIFSAYQLHLYPFLGGYPEDKQEEIATSIYFRMQVTCGTFKEILLKADPPNEALERLIEKPTKFPDKKTCREFIRYQEYMYQESTGDTVKLFIKDKHWIEHFKDGTYSKLKYHWLTDCEFELEFLESNNEIRKSLSNKGERYKYYIIKKETGYFDLAVDIKKTDKVLGFKVYYQTSVTQNENK